MPVQLAVPLFETLARELRAARSNVRTVAMLVKLVEMPSQHKKTSKSKADKPKKVRDGREVGPCFVLMLSNLDYGVSLDMIVLCVSVWVRHFDYGVPLDMVKSCCVFLSGSATSITAFPWTCKSRVLVSEMCHWSPQGHSRGVCCCLSDATFAAISLTCCSRCRRGYRQKKPG